VPSPGDTGVTPDQKVPVSKPALAAGIAPGSFLGLLMDNNKRGTFDDDIVIAQSNTFILGEWQRVWRLAASSSGGAVGISIRD